MTRLFLSWRSLLMLALSTDPPKVTWLVDNRNAGRALVSPFSIIKATCRFPYYCTALGLSPSISFDKFVRSKLNALMIVPYNDVSITLVAELVERHGVEDMELFAVACAIQNSYLYQCWDDEDMSFGARFFPELRVAEAQLRDV